MAPPYGTSPLVVTKLTTPLFSAGRRQDPAVDSQMEQATKLAATDALDPELEPEVSRSVSYGLHTPPPQDSSHVRSSPPPKNRLFNFAAPAGVPPPPLYS